MDLLKLAISIISIFFLPSNSDRAGDITLAFSMSIN